MGLKIPAVYDGAIYSKLSLGDVFASNEVAKTLTTVGAGTITGAILASNRITRTGPTAAYTDTTDTATSIIAAFGSIPPQPGSTYRCSYVNGVSFPCTLAAGTGVTITGNILAASSTAASVVIPGGATANLSISLDNTTAATVVSATTTSSSKAVTGITDAQLALISVGQLVSGTGITAGTRVAAVQIGTGVTLDTNASATGTLVALTFAPMVTVTVVSISSSSAATRPGYQYSAVTVGTSTLSLGRIEGAVHVGLGLSGQGAITLTTPTAAQMTGAIPNAQPGDQWKLDIYNRNSATVTLAVGSGVTFANTLACTSLSKMEVSAVIGTSLGAITMTQLASYPILQ